MNRQFDEELDVETLDDETIDEMFASLHLPNDFETVFSATSLVAKTFKPMQWAVKGLLPEGCVLFAGRPKLGKSWLAYQIAIAIASGGSVLGKIPVRRGEVLYMALEDGMTRLQWRLKKLLRDAPVPDRLHLTTEWPALDEGGLEDLEKWLRRHAYTRLIIIDTFQRVKPSSDGSSVYSIDFNSLARLTDLTHEFPVCIMVIHHTRKAGAEDAFDTVSGSTGLTGAVDATLVLKRSRGRADAEMHITGRDLEESAKALKFDQETMMWQLLGEASEVAMGVDRAAILNLLRESEGGMRPNQIADYLDKTVKSVRSILYRMLKDGQVKLLDRGLYTARPISLHEALNPTEGKANRG